MAAIQWRDLMGGEPLPTLTELPCDCWGVAEGPEPGTHALVCESCGWYRIIPESDVPAAQVLESALEGYIQRLDAPDA